MPSIADYLLLAVCLLGHVTLMLALCNRFVIRMRDTPSKRALMWAWIPASVALFVISARWIGLAGFGESFLFRAPWPQKLLAPWQWLACAWPVAGVITELRRRRRPVPAELLARHTRMVALDLSAFRGPARLLARGDLARVEVCELTLAPAALPVAFDGLRIAHLSDFHHDGEARSRALLAAVKDEVACAAPDIVAFTGDIVPFLHGRPDSLAEAAATLGDLRAGDGVYAVMGNHDLAIYGMRWADAAQVHDALEQQGVQVLRNEAVRIRRDGSRLCLAGMDDYWSGSADLDTALRECGPDDFCILLTHNPDAVGEASRRGLDIQLSGHYHGGQVVLCGVSILAGAVLLEGSIVCGLHKVADTLLHVSRGQSVHHPFRLGSTPQVTLITLRCPEAHPRA